MTPIGLVKMEATQKNNPQIGGPIKMELVSTAKDAKSSITKAPKPFDQAAFMKQMMAGASAGGARQQRRPASNRGELGWRRAQPTEAPTPRRLAEARRRGEVAVSRDLVSAGATAAALGTLLVAGEAATARLLAYFREALSAGAPRASDRRGGLARAGLAALVARWRRP